MSSYRLGYTVPHTYTGEVPFSGMSMMAGFDTSVTSANVVRAVSMSLALECEVICTCVIVGLQPSEPPRCVMPVAVVITAEHGRHHLSTDRDSRDNLSPVMAERAIVDVTVSLNRAAAATEAMFVANNDFPGPDRAMVTMDKLAAMAPIALRMDPVNAATAVADFPRETLEITAKEIARWEAMHFVERGTAAWWSARQRELGADATVTDFVLV